MTAHHNHWDTSIIRDETSRNISSTSTIESPEVVRQLEMMNKNFLEMTRQIQTVKTVDTKCETCGGPHSFIECPAVGGYTQETAYATTGSLPRNIISNPRADLKAITTRSGVTLAGPSVSLPFKEVDREPETITDQMHEVTKDKVQLITENIQPPVTQTQVPIDEPVVAPKPKPTIPYPSRANKQKLREKDDIIALKFLEIFRNLHFELSFVDALLHMPKKVPFFNRFVVVDYVVDPRVPLILGRPFLRTGRALIDVYGEELTLRIDDEAITFKVGQTLEYSYKDVESINRIDVACEEYVQEGGDFILEEIKTFLQTLDELSNLDDDYYDTEGDILYLEKLLNKDPSPNLPLVKTRDLKQVDATMTKPLIDEPPDLKLKELP
nr:reverse transcriptase domain-containing protein [Tanacetum cinerariifolium]